MNNLQKRRKLEWQRNNCRLFSKRMGYSLTAHYSSGGNREAVLIRDGYKCVECGMTDIEHKARWNRPITVDHKDKNRKNNRLENLQTLCLPCHGRKDISKKLIFKIPETEIRAIKALRSQGMTYQEISKAVGRSIAVAWKYGKV